MYMEMHWVVGLLLGAHVSAGKERLARGGSWNENGLCWDQLSVVGRFRNVVMKSDLKVGKRVNYGFNAKVV
jgi:hypothetical protein